MNRRRPDLVLVLIGLFCRAETAIRGRECPVCSDRYHQLDAHLAHDHYPGAA